MIFATITASVFLRTATNRRNAEKTTIPRSMEQRPALAKPYEPTIPHPTVAA
jgi:hypothetical protein